MHRDYGGQTIRITLTTHTHTGGRENLQSRQETLQVNKIGNLCVTVLGIPIFVKA